MGAQSSKEFPYEVGDSITFDGGFGSPMWTMHTGTCTTDGNPVTIFKFDRTNASAQYIAMADNALKRIKRLRHPNVVKYLGGTDIGTTSFIVTEPIVPLSHYLESSSSPPSENPYALSLGLHQIITVVGWLNTNRIMHCNIAFHSVFCTKAGEWKLMGFELASEPNDPAGLIQTQGPSVIPEKYQSPEVSKKMWPVIERSPHCIDSWMMACLIFELFNGPFSQLSDLQKTQKIPKNLLPQYKKLLTSAANARISSSELLTSAFFSNPFIETSVFIDTITVRDDKEKENFFKKLDQLIEGFPTDYIKYKILPALINALDYGSANARVLAPLLKIGTQLTSEEYNKYVTPSVVKWFQSPDPQMRVNLLQNLPCFAQHLQGSLIDSEIYPHIASGFSHPNPTMRELTVKSMVHFVPKMNAVMVEGDVMSRMAKLQLDPEPGIRTNTTICLGLLAPNLPEKVQERVLVAAFSRALRDPFGPARISGIKSFHSTIQIYGKQDIATKIIPVLSIGCTDEDKQVREASISALKEFVSRLERFVLIADGPTAEGDHHDGHPSRLSSEGTSDGSSAAGKMLNWALGFTSKLYPAGQSPSSQSSTPPSTGSAPPSTPSKVVPAATTAKPSRSLVSDDEDENEDEDFDDRRSSSSSSSSAKGWGSSQAKGGDKKQTAAAAAAKIQAAKKEVKKSVVVEVQKGAKIDWDDSEWGDDSDLKDDAPPSRTSVDWESDGWGSSSAVPISSSSDDWSSSGWGGDDVDVPEPVETKVPKVSPVISATPLKKTVEKPAPKVIEKKVEKVSGGWGDVDFDDGKEEKTPARSLSPPKKTIEKPAPKVIEKKVEKVSGGWGDVDFDDEKEEKTPARSLSPPKKTVEKPAPKVIEKKVEKISGGWGDVDFDDEDEEADSAPPVVTKSVPEPRKSIEKASAPASGGWGSFDLPQDDDEEEEEDDFDFTPAKSIEAPKDAKKGRTPTTKDK